MEETCEQVNAGVISNVTSWVRFKFTGQIEKEGTPAMTVELQPDVAEKAERDRPGVLGGIEVAFTVIVFILEVPLGSDNCRDIVYVPFGKVIGKGVLKVELD
jgi:hypothetical protein